MTATAAALRDKLLTGRLCRVCRQPTGAGRRSLCASPYCANEAKQRNLRRRRAEQAAYTAAPGAHR